MGDEGKLILIVQNPDDIQIGKYRIAHGHFAYLAEYVCRGGFCGWCDGESPDFASSALEAIKSSQNPIYKVLQKR